MKKIILSAMFLAIGMGFSQAQKKEKNMTKTEIKTEKQGFREVKSGKFNLMIFNASENSFGVASVLVSGEKDAILVDAQFTLAEAELVAKKIKASGKNLTKIYISHNDPDFYFGLEVFKKHFPNVTAYATPMVVEKISQTAQKKLEVWGGRLGNAITSNVVLPQVIKQDFLELENEKIHIIGLENHPERTFVWIPSAKAVVGGISVFGDKFHLWTADAQTPESRQKWTSVLNEIIALKPKIVVPAHGKIGDELNLKSVEHTKKYLEFYESALKAHKTSESLMNAIKKQYPNLSFSIALQIGAKVNTGEMPW